MHYYQIMKEEKGCAKFSTVLLWRASDSLLVVTLPHAAWSYAAFQRLPYVSDGEPFCATCHSSVDASYHPELPAEASQAQVYTTKHYKALEEGIISGV